LIKIGKMTDNDNSLVAARREKLAAVRANPSTHGVAAPKDLTGR
jgi:hypothetical protein